MPFFIKIWLCLSIMLVPAGVWASEDSDPFLFGDDIPLDVAEGDFSEEYEPVLQSTKPADDAFEPPVFSSSSSVPELPDLPPLPPALEYENTSSSKAPSPIPSDQELTDTIKQDSAVAKPSLPIAKVEDSWVGKLAAKNPLSLISKDDEQTSAEEISSDASLEQMVASARNSKAGNRKSNASVFDISGIMLRMSLKQVDETMQNRGFRKIMQKYQIPNFIKWRNEELCRNSGVVGYERIENCVTERSKKDKQHYVQTAQYAKYDTKEEVVVTLSSNFTDNKVYKIVYKSQAADIRGNSPKANYLRNIKIYDFWKKINQKYGKPDNKENVTWGLGGNKPFLKAATGYLKLEDPMLRELDYTRMSREDQRYMNTDLYSF